MDNIFKSDNQTEIWELLRKHTADTLCNMLMFCAETYKTLFEAFSQEELRSLRQSLIKIIEEKNNLKKMRRKETMGLRRIESALAFERSTWYHLCTNSCQQMLNTLTRIGEPMKEHTDNSFSPLSEMYIQEFSPHCRDLYHIFEEIAQIIKTDDYTNANEVSERAKNLKHTLATLRKTQTMRLHENSAGSLRMDFVYLNLIQESHELLSEVRNLLRGSNKFFAPYITGEINQLPPKEEKEEEEEEYK